MALIDARGLMREMHSHADCATWELRPEVVEVCAPATATKAPRLSRAVRQTQKEKAARDQAINPLASISATW